MVALINSICPVKITSEIETLSFYSYGKVGGVYKTELKFENVQMVE